MVCRIHRSAKEGFGARMCYPYPICLCILLSSILQLYIAYVLHSGEGGILVAGLRQVNLEDVHDGLGVVPPPLGEALWRTRLQSLPFACSSGHIFVSWFRAAHLEQGTSQVRV